MIAFLILLVHLLVSPFKTQARLEAESCAAATPIACAASARTLEAEADGGGSTALRLALSAVSVGNERRDDCPTGDGYPVVLTENLIRADMSSEIG